jgi:hypothetical protein
MKFIGKTGIRTMFVIECDSGKNITKHTYFQSEEEVLILPATRFIAISCEDQSNGLHVIHLKEIPTPFTLLDSICNSNISLTIESKPLPRRKSLPRVYNSTYWNSKLEQFICENKFSSSINLYQEQLIDQDIP